MRSANSSSDGAGTTSSQSHFGIRDSRIQQIVPFVKLPASLECEAMALSSSGQSYTLTELCTCTDYSRPIPHQMRLPIESLMRSGVTYSTNSGDPKCEQCGLVRPYRITYLSM